MHASFDRITPKARWHTGLAAARLAAERRQAQHVSAFLVVDQDPIGWDAAAEVLDIPTAKLRALARGAPDGGNRKRSR